MKVREAAVQRDDNKVPVLDLVRQVSLICSASSSLIGKHNVVIIAAVVMIEFCVPTLTFSHQTSTRLIHMSKNFIHESTVLTKQLSIDPKNGSWHFWFV